MFSVNYIVGIEAEGVSNNDSLEVIGSIESIVNDHVSKLTFNLAENQETEVVIPGLNAIISLMLLADKPVNISLTEQGGTAIYDGTLSTRLSKYYGSEGINYDHIKIRAGSEAAKVTVVVTGKS